jgi:formylmethanofuran dehydrogenase subunit E
LSKKILVALALLLIWSISAPAGVKWSQSFYFQVEPIKIKDPMAVVAGSTKPGENVFEIGIEDAGMYTGHICPCVAGGYKLTELALKTLYGTQIPERGEIRIVANALSEPLEVVSYVTGVRMFYGTEGHNSDFVIDKNLNGETGDVIIIFQRKDTDRAVKVTFHKHLLSSPEDRRKCKTLKKKIMEGKAAQEEKEHFWRTKQEKVKKILLGPPEGLFEVEELKSFMFPVAKMGGQN